MQGGAGAGAGGWPAQLLKHQAPAGGGTEAVGSVGALLHPAPSLHALEHAAGAHEAPGAPPPSVWNCLAQQMGMEARVAVGGLDGVSGLVVSGARDAASFEQHDASQRQQQVAELQQHLAHMMQHNSSAVQLAALANRSLLQAPLVQTPSATPSCPHASAVLARWQLMALGAKGHCSSAGAAARSGANAARVRDTDGVETPIAWRAHGQGHRCCA